MLLSTGVSPCPMNKCSNPSFTASLPQKPILKIAPFSLNPTPIHNRTITPTKICALTQESSTLTDAKIERKEKLTVEVKPMEKPRLVLKFIWMEKNIGIAIDQVIPGGHGTIPLSPYYFWPRKDAWEELKVLLEGKKWISQKQMVLLLNQATDIINLWQQSGGDSA